MLGALILVLSGVGRGVAQQKKALARVQALEELLRLLQGIQREIQYRALPLDEIYEQLEKSKTILNLSQWHSLRTPCLPEVLTERKMRKKPAFSSHT